MSGIEEVARLSGVSTATVSRAMRGLPNVSPATRSTVLAAAKALGYVASPSATGLSSGRHHAVAVVIPSIHRWFDASVVEGVDSVLRGAGYDMFIVNLVVGLGKRERLFHNSLLRKRADGVIALGIDFADDERRELRSLDMPAIVVGAPVRGIKSIGIDETRASTLAMEHLLSLGHRRIGHVGGVDDYGMARPVGLLRRGAWENSLRAGGIEPRSDWFTSGSFLLPQGKVAARALLDRADRPTAVFAASDDMAFGVLLAAAELGLRVPEDVSVVGIDDSAWAEAFGLTTVHQDPFEQGATAAGIMLAELHNLDSPVQARVTKADCWLVVRRTTGPPAVGSGPAVEDSSTGRRIRS